MDFTTYGKTIHPDREVPLYVDNENKILENHHSNFRLFVVKSGSILLDLQDTRLFIEAPALFCLNNQDKVTIINTTDLDLLTVYFKPMIINTRFGATYLKDEELNSLSFTDKQDHMWLHPFIYNNGDINRYVKLGPSSITRILDLCGSLERELKDQPDGFWPCRARSFFLETLYGVHNMQSRYDHFKNIITPEMQSLENIMIYIHTHYRDEITLATLVETFNMNRTKINDLFTKATGKSVIRYLIDIRIKLACLILRDTLRPIKEIAYQTGFNDVTHFGRTFKNLMKTSPTQYRNEFNWMLAV